MKFLDVPQSGSEAGTTSSRNRYGQYKRRRATPVQPRTAAQMVVRAHLAQVAAAWRAITDAQRAGWTGLGGAMSRNDSLGQSHTFNGYGAFCSVNTHRLLAGDAIVNDAPALATPLALATLTPAAAAGAATHTVAFTATPMPASTKLLLEVSPQMSSGRTFNRRFTVLTVTAAAAASPLNIAAAYIAKNGALIAGQRIFYRARAYYAGFVSGPIVASAVVAA